MGVRHINPEGLHRSPAFSQAVVVEQPTKTIYIGGQNGVDADGKIVGSTLGEQAVQALRRIAIVLESEGGSLANVVHWRIAVLDGLSRPGRPLVRGGRGRLPAGLGPGRPAAGHHRAFRRRPRPRVPARDRRRRRRVRRWAVDPPPW